MDDCININCDKMSVCIQEVNVYGYMGDMYAINAEPPINDVFVDVPLCGDCEYIVDYQGLTVAVPYNTGE